MTARQKQFGLNEIQSDERLPIWLLFLSQFANALMILLLAASIISIALGNILLQTPL